MKGTDGLREKMKDEYIYDDENGYYVWYNNFKEAFEHLSCSTSSEERSNK